jgi:hypothetical protein
MSETGNTDISDILGRLSPYEVACLAFTSPREVNDAEDNSLPVVLTDKDAYLWAGAIAYILTENRQASQDNIIDYLRGAVRQQADELRRYSGNIGHSNRLGIALVGSFLQQARHSPDLLHTIIGQTEEAIRSLEAQGLIEDPLFKKIGRVLCGILLFLPLNFSSVTTAGGNAKVSIEAAAYAIDVTNTGQQTDIQFKLKLYKIIEFFKDRVPQEVGSALKASADPQP